MKRILALMTVLVLGFVVVACTDLSNVDSIEFKTTPKTAYTLNEPLEAFTIVVKFKDDTSDLELDSTDSRVAVISFDTTTVGTRTYTVSYLDATISVTYTVSESLEELFAGGSGTEADPYQIATPQHLSNVRTELSAHFVLVADIDLTGISWIPIGEITVEQLTDNSYRITIVNAFSGVLDGDGHEIKITVLEDAEFTWGYSIFQAVRGTSASPAVIKNIDIDVTIDLEANSATTLASTAQHALFENINVIGSISATSASGLISVGYQGVVLDDVHNAADLTSVRTSGTLNYSFLGGLITQVAVADGGELIIKNSSNSGNLTHLFTSDIQSIMGAFIGQYSANTNYRGTVVLEDVANTGTLTGNGLGLSPSFYGVSYDESGVAGTTSQWYESAVVRQNAYPTGAEVFVGRIHNVNQAQLNGGVTPISLDGVTHLD